MCCLHVTLAYYVINLKSGKRLFFKSPVPTMLTKLLLLLLPAYMLAEILAFQTNNKHARVHGHYAQPCSRSHQKMHWLTIRAILINTDQDESTIDSPHIIQHLKFSDIPKVADILTSAFHPELDDNWIMRSLRVLLETDRLQSNFPYDDNDHYYLVIIQSDATKKIVGFCDVDFRSPPDAYNTNLFSMFTSSSNHIIRKRPYLSDLAIDPRHRRKGLASSLMAKVEDVARLRGINEMYLCVAESNVGALKMYNGLGYEVLDYVDGNLGLGVDVRLLRSEL